MTLSEPSKSISKATAGRVFLIHRYSRKFIRDHPESLFVFGDNMMRAGYGGQAAAARDEPNAVGVATKKAPGIREQDYFSDKELLQNCVILHLDMQPLFEAICTGTDVYWPADDIGTGLSSVEEKAPQTWDFLQTLKRSLFNRAKSTVVLDY